MLPLGPRKIELRVVRKDGSIAHIISKPTRFSINGKTKGFLAIMTEITEQKKSLEKMKILNEKLEVIGSLARHDVRNKLSTVMGRIFLAKQKLNGDAEAQEDLVEAQRAIEEAERILNFEKNYENLGMEKLAFASVSNNVKEAVTLLPAGGTELEGVKIIDNCQGIHVLADSMLQPLFYNLIDNSLKHGGDVSQISVDCETEKDGLKLIYEDNGVGIPKSEKKKIFEKGYWKGTGYGLYLIRKMCEVYGWAIKETGQPGKGAQFTITIPKTNTKGEEAYRFH